MTVVIEVSETMFLSAILISVISCLTLIYLWFKTNFSYWTLHPQVPSVKGRIFSGNFLDFLTFKTNFGFHLASIYEDKKFENEAVVGIYGLYRPALLIRAPELLKSVFIKDFDLFRNRPCEGGDHDPYGSLNLFFARYPYWREIRAKLVPVFSSGKLKHMFPLIQQVGENLEVFLNKQPERCVHNLADVSNHYVIDVLSCTILGITSNCIENSKTDLLDKVLKLVEFRAKRAWDMLLIFYAPKLNPVMRPKVFDASVEQFLKRSIIQIMAERESSGVPRHDLIDAFLKIKHEAAAKGDDVGQCVQGLIAQTCILIFAAFDSSIRSISLSLLEVAKDEAIQQRLREEILQALVEGNGEISYERLNKMEYLDMVLNETFRMYPALPITERMHEFHPNKSEGFNLKPYYDYELPNEMPVYVSVFGIHYDEKVIKQIILIANIHSLFINFSI